MFERLELGDSEGLVDDGAAVCALAPRAPSTDCTRDDRHLIEGRYCRSLRTVATSNYAPSELAVQLGHDEPVIGQRIVSRLVDSCKQLKLQDPAAASCEQRWDPSSRIW